jgi:hypothetical protein
MTNELKNELKEKPEIRYNPLKNKGLLLDKPEENELKLYLVLNQLLTDIFSFVSACLMPFSRSSHRL